MKKMDLEWLNIAPLLPDYKDEITADIRKMYADGIITSTAFSMTLVPEGDPVFQIIFLLPDSTFHDAQRHGAIICPVSRRRVEVFTGNHFRDAGKRIHFHELHRRAEAIPHDQPPQHPFDTICFFPVCHPCTSFLSVPFQEGR